VELRNAINEIKSTLKFLNEFIEEKAFIDFFKVASYNGRELIIYGSNNFTTCHQLTIIFHDVSFFSGDFEWSRDDENELIQLIEIDETPGSEKFKFRFQSDGYYHSNHQHKIEICAKAISYNTDIILYFEKENLEPGEKIAEWVKSSKKG